MRFSPRVCKWNMIVLATIDIFYNNENWLKTNKLFVT